MKAFIILCFLACATAATAQTYKYYFIEIRATGKAEIALKPEGNIVYSDIDSLVCERSTDNRGKEQVKEKRYSSYSEAFNKLSSAGLEFFQFANLPTFGGGTAIIAGEMRANYMVWRRRAQD
jgi:hypothetical protein